MKRTITAIQCLILSLFLCATPAQSYDDDDFDLDLDMEMQEEDNTDFSPSPVSPQKDLTVQNQTEPSEKPKTEEKNIDKAKNLFNSLTSNISQKTSGAKKEKKVKKQSPYSNLSLLDKVRRGIPFDQEEMEAWILNTPNINKCYENGQTMLLYLVTRYTDTASLLMLIENGADVQTHCTPQYEALFIAAINNPSASMVETLLNNGANIVERDFERNTALILAATFNSSSAVLNTLLDFGLKTETQNKYGFDALMMSAYENGRIPVIETLLDNGANVNATDFDGRTPLMAAAIRGRDEVMQYLIQRGADYKATDKNGLSVLDYYNKRHYLETLNFTVDSMASPAERLEKEFKFITEKHHFYNTMLIEGVQKNDNEEAEKQVTNALKNLADVDVTDANGCTPLLNATRLNKPFSILEKLINAKADTSATCNGGQSVLMFISQHAQTEKNPEDQIEKLEYLLNNGADINKNDENGNTPLMYAIATKADKSYILALINNGADVNTTTEKKLTPLWIAVRMNQFPEIVKLLIEYGANTNSPDINGETPVWYQLRTNGNEEITGNLLRGGANVDKPNNAGDLPLWYAIDKGYSIELIENIIMTQKNLDVKNSYGDTPLLYAVKHEYPAATVKLLLEQGANPQIPDRNGNTMYDILQNNQFFGETMQKRTRERVLSDW